MSSDDNKNSEYKKLCRELFDEVEEIDSDSDSSSSSSSSDSDSDVETGKQAVATPKTPAAFQRSPISKLCPSTPRKPRPKPLEVYLPPPTPLATSLAPPPKKPRPSVIVVRHPSAVTPPPPPPPAPAAVAEAPEKEEEDWEPYTQPLPPDDPTSAPASPTYDSDDDFEVPPRRSLPKIVEEKQQQQQELPKEQQQELPKEQQQELPKEAESHPQQQELHPRVPSFASHLVDRVVDVHLNDNSVINIHIYFNKNDNTAGYSRDNPIVIS